MVLVVSSNTSGRWTRKSEEDPKDLKDEKENMKEVFSHWQENISNKIYKTTTSTSTMPPTTSTSTMPLTTTTNNNKEVIEAIEEHNRVEMGQMKKEIIEELEKNKEDILKKMREYWIVPHCLGPFNNYKPLQHPKIVKIFAENIHPCDFGVEAVRQSGSAKGGQPKGVGSKGGPKRKKVRSKGGKPKSVGSKGGPKPKGVQSKRGPSKGGPKSNGSSPMGVLTKGGPKPKGVWSTGDPL